jgi:hypothetical protein
MTDTDWSEYRTTDGEAVPGVKKCLDQLSWSKDALMKWAFRQGKAGKKDLYDVNKKDKEMGLRVHNMIEKVLKGQVEFDEAKEKIGDGFPTLAVVKFERWLEAYSPEITHVEVPLVSDEFRYCGRLDLGGRTKRPAIFDLKITNGVYDDMWIQMRAYGTLWNEKLAAEFGEVEEYHILQIPKQGGFVHHVQYHEELDWAWDAFQNCIALRRIQQGRWSK